MHERGKENPQPLGFDTAAVKAWKRREVLNRARIGWKDPTEFEQMVHFNASEDSGVEIRC